MKRLERGLGGSGAGPDAQRETCAMDSPVVRVQVRVKDLLRGAGFEDEPIDRTVVAQPAPNGTQIGTRELPFHFAPVLVKRGRGGAEAVLDDIYMTVYRLWRLDL